MSSPLELLTCYEPALICIPERRRMISCPIYPCYVPFFHCNYKRSWRRRQKCGDDTEHQCTCICLRIMLKLHITLWKMAGHSCPSSKCRQMCDGCPHSATWKKNIWESQYSQTFGSKRSVKASIFQSWNRQIKQQGVKDIKDKNMADINHKRIPVDLTSTHVLLHSSSVSNRFLLPLQPPYQNWAHAFACLS